MRTNVRMLTHAGVMAALTAVGAFIRFPLGAMSFTLQDMFTVLAGALLGWRWGAASQAAYVALGLLGLPIFTQGGGLGYVFQPSFGFLLGIIPAAALTGALLHGGGEPGGRVPSPGRVVMACLAGLGVMYLIGVPYMGMILNLYLGKGLSVWTIVRTGMLIYLPGDALKVAAVTAAVPALCRRVGRGEA